MLDILKLNSHLEQVSADLLPNVPDKSQPLNIDARHFCQLKNRGEGRIWEIHINSLIEPLPSSLFQIKMNHRIELELKESILEEDLEKEVYDICDVVGSQVSHLVSSLTMELIGTRIILPPHLNQSGFEIL